MIRVCFCLSVLLAMGATAEPFPQIKNPYVWSRAPKAITLKSDGAAFTIRHTGSQDWAFFLFPSVDVKPGDEFTYTCQSEKLSDSQKSNEACLSVVLRDNQGKVMSWNYGKANILPGKPARAHFLIPKGVAKIEPRVTGWGPSGLTLKDLKIERVANRSEQIRQCSEFVCENDRISLRMDPANGCVEVKDLRTGRTWKPEPAKVPWLVYQMRTEKDGRRAVVSFLNQENFQKYDVTYEIEKDRPEFSVEIKGEGAMGYSLNFPSAFLSAPGDRLIVPMNEGLGYPVDEDHQGLGRLVAYGGHGICMSFFGVQEDRTGSGWTCILETPDDALMDAHRDAQGMWTAGPSWTSRKKKFGYPRRVRYFFQDRGGYVAMCKTYRAYAKKIGLLKTFTEKVKRNPNIDLLLGAANIWYMGGNISKVDLVKELKEKGIDRILWSADGSAEEIQKMRKFPNVLVGRYDIYQDVMDPSTSHRFRHPHNNLIEAFPQDIAWSGPSRDQWTRGWELKAMDGEMIPCAVLCDSKALPYARKRICKELKKKAYTARFVDTTVAAAWRECWNPAHPMTRSESKYWRMRLLRIVSEEFGLVCGSETGHDASVPYCDYFEGMLSLGRYRVPDSGRNLLKIWDEVPERTAKYMTGEKYRLPLWELVYHDCVVAQWYWGDYNNKLPKLWKKKDLFNALYGTPPMYLFNADMWKRQKDQFAASYQKAEPVSRLSAYAEMVDHRALNSERTVQQSRFSNGVIVTVNFGDLPFRLQNGKTVQAMDFIVNQ